MLGVGIEPTKARGRQIYSLLRLTTSLSQHNGAVDGTRIRDLALTKGVLYQLSYNGLNIIVTAQPDTKYNISS